ncbi:MAG: cupin domain-containing protein [Thermoplasmata archaeon]|nr:cupin domain-containing protein [Thermoplasmata archaeon]
MPFPSTVRNLPKTNLHGIDVFVHDDGRTQVLFMELPRNRPEATVPVHTHDDEWGIVVEGEIEMNLAGQIERHGPGSTHWIQRDLPHSFRFAPGTSSIHYFIERRVTLSR